VAGRSLATYAEVLYYEERVSPCGHRSDLTPELGRSTSTRLSPSARASTSTATQPYGAIAMRQGAFFSTPYEAKSATGFRRIPAELLSSRRYGSATGEGSTIRRDGLWLRPGCLFDLWVGRRRSRGSDRRRRRVVMSGRVVIGPKAARTLAKQINDEAWSLLDNPDRTEEDDEAGPGGARLVPLVARRDGNPSAAQRMDAGARSHGAEP
jgi:hypothetical protein